MTGPELDVDVAEVERSALVSVTARMPAPLRDRLVRCAVERNMTMSAVIRVALREYFRSVEG